MKLFKNIFQKSSQRDPSPTRRYHNRLTTWVGALTLTLAVVSSQEISAQITLDAYDFTGASTPATATANVFNANLDSTNVLSRGAGAAASAGSNSFRTTGFKNDGISTANTDYFQVSLSAAAGFTLSLSTIDTRVNGTTGYFPATSQFAYSLDNGATFTLIGSAAANAAASTTGSAPISFTLSGVAALQNVSDTTTVILRYYASGTTTTGGFGFYSPAAGSYGLAINGTLTSATPASPNYFGTTGQGVNAGSTVFDTTTADFNTKNDGTGTAKVFDNTQLGVFGGTSGAVTISTVTANAGIQFAASGYVFNGGTLTLGTVPTVEVTNTADTATINTQLSGTAGLTKIGAGTLVLGSTTSDFTGGVVISAGTLSISADANLGGTTNGIALGGGVLQSTASISLNAGRDLTGTGSLAPAAGTVLTFNGTVNAGVTVADTGTVQLAGASNTSSGLAFTSAGTLNVSGGALSLTGGITTTQAAGTATLAGAMSLSGNTGVTHTFSVGDGTAATDLLVSANLSGTGSIAKTGTGTLELTGSNATFGGFFRHGVAGTSGGTVIIHSNTALGTNQYQANGGTLSTDTPVVLGNSISVGANTVAPAVFTGSSIEFSGTAGMFGGAIAHAIQVDNTTTFSGVFGPTSGNTTSTLAISGAGNLVLSGSAANTFTEAVTVGGTATLNLAKAGALGANTAVTVNNGATLVLSGSSAVADRVNNAAAVTIAGGGTLNTGGLSEGTRPGGPLTGGSVTGVGALTLSGTAGSASVINFGSGTAGSSLVFSSLAASSKGAVVTILNWGGLAGFDDGTSTNDRLLFTSDPGFTVGDLASFNFSGFAPGGIELSYGGIYEIVPVPEPGTVLGGILLVSAAAWNQRRRLRSLLAA